MDTARLLTVDEAATKLGMTSFQVYRRLQRGDLAYTSGGRHGSQYMIDSGDLEKYIEAGQPLSAPKQPPSIYYTVPQAAALTGLTCESVRNLCLDGTLRFVRGEGKNGHFRIFKADVQAFIAEHAN